MPGFLDDFVSGLKDSKTGSMITTVQQLRENQFGIPLKHYAQQYLFGATGLRLHVFNSIQGQKEVGKSTLLFDIMGTVGGAPENGGHGGLCVLYELEDKISPSVLYSILRNYGERAVQACILRLGRTLEEAMQDLNASIIPLYLKACPKLDKPLLIGLDSIGGAASQDTIGKLEKDGVAGKGYYNKQHFMKYFCENQGAIFGRLNLPVVIFCINQEREMASSLPFGGPQKVITGGKAQLFKDGHMISANKRNMVSGDGNLVTLRTTKTSFCDSRKIEVQFRWNKFGRSADDAYEARFCWGLAAANCIANPERGVGEIRDICNVSVSDKELVTCPQLGLKSVSADDFETALMANDKVLAGLHVYQKIEQLRDLSEYAKYLQTIDPDKKKKKEEVKPVVKGRGKNKEPIGEPPKGDKVPLFEAATNTEDSE